MASRATSAELAKRLQKRLDVTEFQKYNKRFNRNGVGKSSSFGKESPSVDVNGANTLASHKETGWEVATRMCELLCLTPIQSIDRGFLTISSSEPPPKQDNDQNQMGRSSLSG